MTENRQLLTAAGIDGASGEALNINILCLMHSFARMNLGSLLNDVSQMEFLALYMIDYKRKQALSGNGSVNVSSIANLLGVTTPAISRLLKGLEEKELLERVTDRANRRNTDVILTKKGEAALENDEKKVTEFSKRIIERIGRVKLSRLCLLSAELGSAVQEELARYSSEGG